MKDLYKRASEEAVQHVSRYASRIFLLLYDRVVHIALACRCVTCKSLVFQKFEECRDSRILGLGLVAMLQNVIDCSLAKHPEDLHDILFAFGQCFRFIRHVPYDYDANILLNF